MVYLLHVKFHSPVLVVVLRIRLDDSGAWSTGFTRVAAVKTKCKPSAPSARVLMREDTAPQLAILFDGTRAHAVYICQQSRRLAASAGKLDGTSAFPCCAGQLVAKGH